MRYFSFKMKTILTMQCVVRKQSCKLDYAYHQWAFYKMKVFLVLCKWKISEEISSF